MNESNASIATPPARSIGMVDVMRAFLGCRDNLLFVIPCATLIGIGLATGPRWTDVLWFAFGWLVFLPQEWLTHVYILHWRGIKSETSYRWMYRLHYGHHDFPKRDDLMYMPLWLTVPTTVFNLVFFLWFADDLRDSLAAFSGALLGYIVFEWAHLLCHVPIIPKSAMWRKIRDRHLAHHYVNERHWYSVSPPAQFIDSLFGTGGQRQEVEKTGTGRLLLENLDNDWVQRARERFAARSSGDPTQSLIWVRHAELKKAVSPGTVE